MTPWPDTVLMVDDTPANLGVLLTGLRNMQGGLLVYCNPTRVWWHV